MHFRLALLVVDCVVVKTSLGPVRDKVTRGLTQTRQIRPLSHICPINLAERRRPSVKAIPGHQLPRPGVIHQPACPKVNPPKTDSVASLMVLLH